MNLEVKAKSSDNFSALKFFLTKQGINPISQPLFYRHLSEFEQMLQQKFAHSPQNMQIQNAFSLMCHTHLRQVRKDGSIYISHPLQVANLVGYLCERPDDETLITALLHDSVEDQSDRVLELNALIAPPLADSKQAALTVLADLFGDKVASNIQSLSNPDFQSILSSNGIVSSDPNYRSHFNTLYATHVHHAIQDPQVCLVKYADFLSNAGALCALSEQKQQAKIALKYLGVIDHFISRVNDNNNPLNTNRQLEMCEQLQTIRTQIKNILTKSQFQI